MRKIQKRISLEPMTSRLPSILPAYMDNQLYFFDDAHLKERDYTYTSNYGMIPVNVVLDDYRKIIPCLEESECLTCSGTSAYTYTPVIEREDVCDQEPNTRRGGCELCRCRIMSFERLSIWYHKFTEYYHLLNDYSHCNTVYSSAVEYYNNEVKRWPEDLYYGTDEQTYIDLDDEIRCMGGIPTTTPSSVTINCNGSTIPKSYQTIDKGFYEWICENIVPTYTIPKEYQDYWQKQTLYYPDVIKWIGWFKERYDKYGVNPDCKTEEGDCCDCTEYVNRGGYNMIDEDNEDSMVFWYNKIQNNIISSLPKGTYACVDIVHHNCYEPFYIMPIELQNSIEDLGEFTIFCEEYKIGVDYRGAEKGAVENTKGGTFVEKDGKVLKLKNDKTGYKYDTTYMENQFDDSAWENVTSQTKSANLTAVTTSKVQSLHIDNHLVDDIGNPIEGLYDTTNKVNHQPPEGSTLQPIYQVGHKYNMVRNEAVDNQFIGDEIDSMKFYYVCLDGTETTHTSAETDNALEAIESTPTPSDDKPYYEDIFCDITYHIGNIYKLNDDKQLEKISGGDGVKYTDTVQFVKTRTEYYLKKMSKDYAPDEKKVASAHTLSYPIYVYNLKRGEEEIVDNTYDTTYNDSLSKVEYSVTREYDETDSKFPIMREEYRLGIAGPESVEGDIYIDRGINSAFEKHLKLGEVTSLESLLQYGNGYFKIMEN